MNTLGKKRGEIQIARPDPRGSGKRTHVLLTFERPREVPVNTIKRAIARELTKTYGDVKVELVKRSSPNPRRMYIRVKSRDCLASDVFKTVTSVQGVENLAPLMLTSPIRATLAL